MLNIIHKQFKVNKTELEIVKYKCPICDKEHVLIRKNCKVVRGEYTRTCKSCGYKTGDVLYHIYHFNYRKVYCAKP